MMNELRLLSIGCRAVKVKIVYVNGWIENKKDVNLGPAICMYVLCIVEMESRSRLFNRAAEAHSGQ